MLDSKSLDEPICMFSCISFEDRCKSSSIALHNSYYKEIKWEFFEIIDDESAYKDECLKLQEKNRNDLVRILNLSNDIPQFNLFDPNLVEEIIEKFRLAIENNNIKTIILDITTIPKICYIPFLKWLLLDNNRELIKEQNFIVSYSKPQEYGNSALESEPLDPSVIINNINEDEKTIWIPCLGFKSEFAKKIWERVRKLDVEKDIIPIMCFPTYRPDYYDRSLILHVKSFEDDIDFIKALKENIIYCSADDPYEIFNHIQQIKSNYSERQIILSPLGTKPTSLGATLAAILFNLPIMTVQAKTYHPDYSKGSADIYAYWVYKDGLYTFT